MYEIIIRLRVTYVYKKYNNTLIKMSVDFLTNANFSEQVISVLATQDSLGITSGSLLTAGGLGVKLSAHIGEQLYVNSVNVTPSLGDIIYEREQVLVNNSSGAIDDLVFYNDITQSFNSIISVEVTFVGQPELNKSALWQINGSLGKDGWVINKRFTGDITNIIFTINNTTISSRSAGQLQYNNPHVSGTTTIRYKANTVSPSGASNDAISYATTPVDLTANTLTYTAVNVNDWDTTPTNIQDALDELASKLNNDLSFVNEYHVSKSGSATGNGSIGNPFLTITDAITQAETASLTTSVIIYIHPGVYTENITLTKPKISLVGLTNTYSNACQINGTVIVTPSDDSMGVFNTIFTLENLLITASGSSSVLTFSGNNTGYIHINNCKIWSSSNSQRIIYITNTSATVPRIKIKMSDLQNTDGTGSIFEVASGSTINGGIYNSFFYGNSSTTIICRGSTSSLVIQDCDIQGTNSYLVDIVSASLVSFLKCSFVNYSLNSSGINMSSTAIAVTYHCLFNIPTNSSFPTNLTPPGTTTGYAVKGVSGANFTYGNVSFVPLTNISGTYYWTTNKISSAITITPSSSTFSTQA